MFSGGGAGVTSVIGAFKGAKERSSQREQIYQLYSNDTTCRIC